MRPHPSAPYIPVWLFIESPVNFTLSFKGVVRGDVKNSLALPQNNGCVHGVRAYVLCLRKYIYITLKIGLYMKK